MRTLHTKTDQNPTPQDTLDELRNFLKRMGSDSSKLGNHVWKLSSNRIIPTLLERIPLNSLDPLDRAELWENMLDYLTQLMELFISTAKESAEKNTHAQPTITECAELITFLEKLIPHFSYEMMGGDTPLPLVQTLYEYWLRLKVDEKKWLNEVQFLYALARLSNNAKQQHVHLFFDTPESNVTKKLTDLCNTLKKSPCDAQAISNTFLALGYLAQQGKVYDIPNDRIIALLAQLQSANPKAQAISNTFLALGYLAQQRKTYEIPNDLFIALLAQLQSANPNKVQEISNTFLALGYLAQRGKTYDIPNDLIIALLVQLQSANLKAQAISNTFLALGYLAQQGKVYDIPNDLFIALLMQLQNANPNAQDISNTFLALGYLAQQGKVYDIPNDRIIALLTQLQNANPNAQAIGNTFLALGYLAQQGKVYDIPNNLFIALLMQLQNANPNAKDISNIFLALGS